MKSIKWILLMAIIGLIFGQVASAQVLCSEEMNPVCADFENRSTDWVQTVTVPKFDPALGTLIEVRLTADACGYQTFRLDSEDSADQCWTARTFGVLTTPMPNGDTLTLNLPPDQPSRDRNFCLPADEEPGDGDFTGNDSYTDFISDCTSEEMTFTDPVDLIAWIGPGTVSFTTTADATTEVIGPGSFDQSIRTFIDETICVVYVYAPRSCISGHKFNSLTDEGLSGWKINLWKDGAMIDTTMTGTGGYYEFCELDAGSYEVCEEAKAGWTPEGPICIPVQLIPCGPSEDNDFMNTPEDDPCGPYCPWAIKNELYTANCTTELEIPASNGLLANERFPNAYIVDPESITIDPKYGTITVEDDGSFVYDPTSATGIYTGTYVIIRYTANNGYCDAISQGLAKIQVRCKRY